jgi:rare lipoprotein A (peptidoglycan hydrolase)
MRYKRVLAISSLILGVFIFFSLDKPKQDFSQKKAIHVYDGSSFYEYPVSGMSTVEDFLNEQGWGLQEEDSVFPLGGTALTSGMSIRVERTRTMTVVIGDSETLYKTRESTLGEALKEVGVSLDEDDIIEPRLETTLGENRIVQLTRVTISEETEETKIAYKTEQKEDDNLSWRKKEVVQKGEVGILEKRIRIARHDGKEVNRKVLGESIIKEPVTEIVRQGTLVKTGKSHTGGASWYAHTGTLSAANPWLPMGSYVKVTNTANGKSVIVKINDRGPFGGGRIIDLDKVAFQEIASLGQGVAQVKMEEITN